MLYAQCESHTISASTVLLAFQGLASARYENMMQSPRLGHAHMYGREILLNLAIFPAVSVAIGADTTSPAEPE